MLLWRRLNESRAIWSRPAGRCSIAGTRGLFTMFPALRHLWNSPKVSARARPRLPLSRQPRSRKVLRRDGSDIERLRSRHRTHSRVCAEYTNRAVSARCLRDNRTLRSSSAPSLPSHASASLPTSNSFHGQCTKSRVDFVKWT